MTSCMIGHTGFIGGYLFKELNIDVGFNSSNIKEIGRQSYDTVYCAAPSGLKWYANKHPEKDKENVLSLIESLKGVKTNRFVLISSIDVYDNPEGQNESDDPDAEKAYGKNRLMIEKFVRKNFHDHLVVRCPIVYGPGFKKNVIYDLINDNNVENIDPSRMLQFYDVRDLPGDIERAESLGLKLVNLATGPLNVGEIAASIFGRDLSSYESPDSLKYYMTSMHSSFFTCDWPPGFIDNSDKVMEKIEDFVKGGKNE